LLQVGKYALVNKVLHSYKWKEMIVLN
jgi:hypothetical protein